MPKTLQNISVFMDPSNSSDISLKGGKMYLNRFCIDEDAAFELSGIYSFRKSSDDFSDDLIKGKRYF